MFENFDLNESLRGLGEKMASWLDSLILNLPNFILAVIVFLLFIIAAKYFGKFIDKVFLRRIRQDSIRQITLKVY